MLFRKVHGLFQHTREFFRDPARLGYVKLAIWVGIILRVEGYLEERSLWGDECWAAMEIVNRTFGEIVRNEYLFSISSRPPMLFVLIEKVFVTLFGNTEYILRFFPFLCSIFSLYLFYSIGKKYLQPRALALAVWFLALSGPLLYHAAEAKRYSTLVFSALLLWYVATHFLFPRYNWRRVLGFGFLAAVLLWLSYASLFVTAAVFLTLGIKLIVEKRLRGIFVLTLAALPILASTGMLYEFVWKEVVASTEMKGYFRHWLWAGQGFSLSTLVWLKKIFLESIHDPGGLSYPAVKAFLMVVGFWILIRKRDWDTLMFLFPIILALSAALIGVYPFHGRVILFLAPVYCLFVAAGLNFFLERPFLSNRWLRAAVLVVIFITPARNGFLYLTTSLPDVDNRKMLQFFGDNYQPGDRIFLNDGARYAFYYYATSLGYGQKIDKELFILPQGNKKLATIGVFLDHSPFFTNEKKAVLVHEHLFFDEKGALQSAVASRKSPFRIMTSVNLHNFFGNGRTWLLLSHSDEEILSKVEDRIRPFFRAKGKKILLYEGKGVAARLYDFSKEATVLMPVGANL